LLSPVPMPDASLVAPGAALNWGWGRGGGGEGGGGGGGEAGGGGEGGVCAAVGVGLLVPEPLREGPSRVGSAARCSDSWTLPSSRGAGSARFPVRWSRSCLRKYSLTARSWFETFALVVVIVVHVSRMEVRVDPEMVGPAGRCLFGCRLSPLTENPSSVVQGIAPSLVSFCRTSGKIRHIHCGSRGRGWD
jgi:hypothetical protein